MRLTVCELRQSSSAGLFPRAGSCRIVGYLPMLTLLLRLVRTLGAPLSMALALLLCGVTLPRAAVAAPMQVEELPPELRGWVPWVMHGFEDRSCPVVQDEAVCLWPGTLELELDASGGRFRLRATTDREVLVPLPGSTERWPQEVRVGRDVAVVLDVEGRPSLRVPAGEHEITGRFVWSRLPERLAVHPHQAQVTLSIDGKKIVDGHRGGDGSVWLAASGAVGVQEPERLELEVFRHLQDGVPMRLRTRVDLRVGGRAREVTLPQVLPAGARPLGVTSSLPVRLDASGMLTVQVQPGNHAVEVDALVPADVAELQAPMPGAPWPEQEVWVFSPDNRLRQVELTGAPGVDPQRTNLPAEWRSLRAFLLRAAPEASGGERLTLKTLRRGEPEAPPNALTLDRQLWLDLDGEGFTVRDLIGGTLLRDHRLVLEAGELGHAVVWGEDQVIVRTEDGASAVELRVLPMDLRAEWRLEESTGALPAVGWSADVERLSAELHLPPGWDLLGASGVDDVSQTWISQWNLFDVFFVLVVALAIARLFGVVWGGVALLGLTLSHGQEGAPYFLWAALLVTAGVLLVLPAGKLRFTARMVWWTVAVALAVTFVGFAVDQARMAFFPATAGGGWAVSGAREAAFGLDVAQESARQVREEEVAEDDGEYAAAAPPRYRAPSSTQRSGAAPQKSGASKKLAAQKDPLVVVQTGPGVPTWQWRTWYLRWSGPVDHAHEMRLWLISPWQNAVIGLLRIVLLGALLWAVLRRPPRSDRPASLGPRRWFSWGRKLGAAAAVASISFVPGLARAEAPSAGLPDAELLGELRRRLTPDRDCGGPCVSVSALAVEAKDRTLRLRAEVHVAAPASYQLPGPAQNLTYSSVLVDGRPSHALVRWTDGFLHLRLTPGRHEVELTAPLPRDELVLSPGTPPRLVRVEASGWQVEGVQEDGRVEGSLAFTRLVSAEASDDDAGSPVSELPPWFEVRRRLMLGVTWSVATTVERVSPTGQPLVVRLPLLPGEQVTESGLSVENGEVVLSFDRDTQRVTFDSSLRIAPEVRLRAAEDRPWSEQWTLDCSVLWRCELSGLAPYEHRSQDHDYPRREPRWMPSFRPWPGEELAVAVQRPEPAAGSSITIDSAHLSFEPGTRLSRATLQLQIRNSAGGSQRVELPADARSVELEVDGVAQPLERTGGELSVPLSPGTTKVRIRWQQPEGLSTRWRAPSVRVDGGVVNVTTTVSLPSHRWLLHTSAQGASWGPAVLFWPYLLLVLAFGVALSRVPKSPLRAWEWMLLGLGLAVVHPVVAVIVASWFFLLAFRETYLPSRPLPYNLVQLLLVGCTLVFLGCLVGVVYSGLVVQPDMGVAGLHSTNERLVWYADRAAAELPRPSVWSAPLWVWRLVMLFWALWLALALLRWLRWGFGCFSAGGAFRRMTARRAPAPPPAGAGAPAEAGSPAEAESPDPTNTPPAPPAEG